MGAIEQRAMRRRFLQFRALAQRHTFAKFSLQLRHPRADACISSLFIRCKNFLERRLAFEHSHRMGTQLRLSPHDRLNKKIREENAGKGHKKTSLVVGKTQFRKSEIHPARTVRVMKSVFTDCAGLRSNRERTTSACTRIFSSSLA